MKKIAQRCIATMSRGRLRYPISVAPMVDVSTPHFLELLHIISGETRYAYYTEMHFSRAIIAHANHLHAFLGPPRPNVVVQLGGADPASMAEAADLVARNGYQEINVNVGCPSEAVQHGAFGAVLMKSPDLVADILTAMQQRVSIPVTVKCRLGVDDLDSFEFLYRFVDTLVQRNHLPHLILHARKCLLRGLSPKQNRSIPPLNYERVYRLAETFKDLPITINGGFKDTSSVAMALQKVDGCMIGRKVMDRPLFLQELDKDIYNQPAKPIEVIVKEYLDYVHCLPQRAGYASGEMRIPPNTALVKPLMMLFHGSAGRAFRRELFCALKCSDHLNTVVVNALHGAGIHINL